MQTLETINRNQSTLAKLISQQPQDREYPSEDLTNLIKLDLIVKKRQSRSIEVFQEFLERT